MFKNLTIKTRLVLTIGLLCGMLVLIGVLGIRGMNAAVAGLETVYKDRVVPLEDLKEISDHYAIEIAEAAHKVRNGSMSWADASREIGEAERDIAKRWGEYLATTLVAEEVKLIDEIKPLMRTTDAAARKLAEILTRQDKAALEYFVVNEMYPIIDPLAERLDKLVTVQTTIAKKEYEEATAQYRSLMVTAIASIILSIVVAAAIGYFLISAITTSLGRAISLANRISEGNLENRIVIDREDEIGTMLKAMQAMNENLVKIVQDVRESAQATASASEQISAGNTNLSQRTEEQASSLEETASSMEEMTSTVKQNADNAARANQMAEATRAQAEKGGHVVGQAISAMGEINASSRKIADIISTIDGIAFQTNLLALNAAVEAARAGEQGRGFAVVATEVRNLAQRSANAAKEIKALIEDSVGKVDAGSRLVEQSGVTLNEIVTSVKKVSDVVADIAAASHEQSSGIDQVNQAVVQMDEMTQQNAALVEEAAAASRSLEEQAQVLTQLMGFFKLGDESKIGFSRPAAHVTHAAQSHAPQAHSTLTHRPQLKTGAATARARIEKSASPKPNGGNATGEWEKF